MSAADDRRFMKMALREGAKGRPSPNPHVGAVIVVDGEVVGRGHHRRAGEAHAEVNALASAGDAARGACLYVTLEPCNHQGRTGPCTEAILAAGIRRVVIGCLDPAEHGDAGAERLRSAGLEVEVGVSRDESELLVADFAKHVSTGLPWVTLKAAVTLDGKMASRTGNSKWITGERSRREAHRLRDRSDAIMVGVETILADDPSLNVRMVRGQDPLRVILDTNLRTPPHAGILDLDSSRPTLIFHGPSVSMEERRLRVRPGVVLIETPVVEERVDLEEVLRELGRRDVVRLLVEGGGTLHGALLDADLADAAAVFVAPVIVGDGQACSFAAGRGVDSIEAAYRIRSPKSRRLGEDILFTGRLFKPAPSRGG